MMREGHPNRTKALHARGRGKWGYLCACDCAIVYPGRRCWMCGRKQPVEKDKRPRPDIDFEERAQ